MPNGRGIGLAGFPSRPTPVEVASDRLPDSRVLRCGPSSAAPFLPIQRGVWWIARYTMILVVTTPVNAPQLLETPISQTGYSETRLRRELDSSSCGCCYHFGFVMSFMQDKTFSVPQPVIDGALRRLVDACWNWTGWNGADPGHTCYAIGEESRRGWWDGRNDIFRCVVLCECHAAECNKRMWYQLDGPDAEHTEGGLLGGVQAIPPPSARRCRHRWKMLLADLKQLAIISHSRESGGLTIDPTSLGSDHKDTHRKGHPVHRNSHIPLWTDGLFSRA